jgi:hypothetical protein
MRRNVQFLSAVLVFSGVLTCVFNVGGDVPVVPTAQAQDDSGTSGQIEGTWLLTVTPPLPQIPPFKVFVSFARGGAFVTSPEVTATGVVVGQSQNGAWTHLGGHEFASTGMEFGTVPDTGQPGIFKIRSIFQLISKDDLVGNGSLSFCDTSGDNCRPLPACSTIQGKRIKAEAPSCPQ